MLYQVVLGPFFAQATGMFNSLVIRGTGGHFKDPIMLYQFFGGKFCDQAK